MVVLVSYGVEYNDLLCSAFVRSFDRFTLFLLLQRCFLGTFYAVIQVMFQFDINILLYKCNLVKLLFHV